MAQIFDIDRLNLGCLFVESFGFHSFDCYGTRCCHSATAIWTISISSVSSRRCWPVRPFRPMLSPHFANVLTADTARVKAASATLRAEYYTLPESLTVLLQLLLSDQPSPIRQLAATQCRASLVPKHWKKLPSAEKVRYRLQLLEGTLREEDKLVRHAAARVITAIAKIDLENGEWLDIFDLLLGAAKNPNPRQREVGTYLLFTCLEVIGEAMMHRFHEMLPIFAKTIRMSRFTSRCTSLLTRCLIRLIKCYRGSREC